jgi:hypothetical protein
MTNIQPSLSAKLHASVQEKVEYFRIAGTKRNRDGEFLAELPRSFRGVGLQEFTCKHLREVCRQRGIQNFSRMDKRTLLIVVENELLVTQEALFDSHRSIVAWPIKPINERDPILLTDLSSRGPQYTFTLDAENPATTQANQRLAYRFDPVALVEMILQTGHRTNPYTRKELTSKQLLRLEHVYISCIRAHPDAPRDKKKILSKRPDMNVNQIARVPKREDLAIDDAEEEMPGPVMQFAPWLTSDTLEDVARRRKILVDIERENEQTRAFLRMRVEDAFHVIKSFFQPLPTPPTQRQADQMLNICLRIHLPILLETVEELFSAACSEMKTILPQISLALLKAKESADCFVRTLASWIFGMLLDDMIEQCSEEYSLPEDDHRWVKAFVNDMSTSHSTKALVKHAATLNLLRLTLDV